MPRLAERGVMVADTSENEEPLLVTSRTPGYAMKETNKSKMLGAVLGKALQSLASGKGVIEVLVVQR